LPRLSLLLQLVKGFHNVFHEFYRVTLADTDLFQHLTLSIQPFIILQVVNLLMQMPGHLQDRHQCQRGVTHIQAFVMKSYSLADIFRQVSMFGHQKSDNGMVSIEALVFFAKIRPMTSLV
jgi:hypothetical protein